ncbi:MAG: TPM domain-containing protein [Tardiphaga sp.]
MKALKAGLLALLLCWGFAALADVAVPRLSGRVVDQTMTLSQADQAALDTTLREFEARKGSQVAVLIVPTTAPESIEQYSIRVAEAWKIGRSKVDDGAILVVAKDDRKLRIEVGYGLEGALTDVTTKRIIDEIITPRFRTGDFAGGIAAGVNQIIKVIDGETLPPPAQRQQQGSDFADQLGQFAPFLLFGVIIGGGILRSMFGRLFGSLATGGLAAVVVWWIVGTAVLAGLAGIIGFVVTLIGDAFLGGGRRGGGGYIGGSGGSWSSGSSGSSGGFSGGGGNFGGGGASGSW